MNSVGICGSDIHVWAHGGFANKKLENPRQILGHEGGGTIVSVGTNVSNLKPGDRVSIEPNIPCMNCTYCKEGRNNLCLTCIEIPPNEGMFQEYYLQPASLCHKIPDNLTLEDAALAEPLACALHAVKRAAISPGQNVLITGSGAIGLLCLLGAKAFGAEKVVCTDVIKSKTDYAVSIGATAGYVVDKDRTILDQVSDIRNLFGGVEPDVTLECTGFESAVCLSLECTRKGGKVALVGLGSTRVNVPLSASSLKELDILGCSKYGNTYELGLKLMASGALPARKVVTHRFPLKQFNDAFTQMTTGGGGKVIIQCE